jgi:hypothetical protein
LTNSVCQRAKGLCRDAMTKFKFIVNDPVI